MIELIANLLGYILNFLNDIFGNFGLAIIGFTIIIKLCLYPLNLKQQKSAKKMAEVQPKLQALQDKYKDNENKELYAQEFAKFQKEEKFSPFTGCLLAIIQIPIILGMFYLVSQPLTYMEKMDATQIAELKAQYEVNNEEKGGWFNNYQEIAIINKSSDLGIDLNFLGINLGQIPGQNDFDIKLALIPLLSMLVTFASVILSKRMTDSYNRNNAQYIETQKSMAVMNYILPVMSGYIAYQVPLGLGLYWLCSNLIQTGIILVIMQQIKAKKI